MVLPELAVPTAVPNTIVPPVFTKALALLNTTSLSVLFVELFANIKAAPAVVVFSIVKPVAPVRAIPLKMIRSAPDNITVARMSADTIVA